MPSMIQQSIEALCLEQGLDKDMVIEAMKDAVKAAARKQFKHQDKTGDSIQVDWNPEEGEVEVSVQKVVVDTVENPSAELSMDEAVELAGDEIELGNNLEAILPRKEQARGEVWNQGERIRVVIADVTKDQKGQQIRVSRASAD